MEIYVDLIRDIDNTTSKINSIRLHIERAILLPKTTKSDYWSDPQIYRGPLTIVKYEKYQFKVIRDYGDLFYSDNDPLLREFYGCDPLHNPGVIIYLNTDLQETIGDVLRLVKMKTIHSNVRVDEINNDKNGLRYYIFIPLSNLAIPSI